MPLVFRRIPLLIALTILVGACGSGGEVKDPRADLVTDRVAGPDGKTHLLSGKASWYGERFQGRMTANGESFDMNAFTAAHKTLPFHTIIRVTEVESLKSVVVRVNDRGPYGEGRVVDLSRAAASDLGMIRRGIVSVQLEVLQWGDGSRVEIPGRIHHIAELNAEN